MEIPKLEQIENKEKIAKVEIDDYSRKANYLFIIIVFSIIFFILIFGYKRFINSSFPIDYNIWGSFGDFYGGLIGTLIAAYAIILMIRTLQKQIDSNLEIEKSNRMVISEAEVQSKEMKAQTKINSSQLFDSQFIVLFKQYLEAVEAYEDSSSKKIGRKRIDEIVKNFRDGSFIYKTTYMRRCKSASKLFEDLYVNQRQYMSVHLRTLYQVFKFIGNADVDDKTRLLYAKLVRGQLSDSEMFMLRYNCNSYYGHKMQTYCNQYNLLKHISIMGLLEFKKWSAILNSKEFGNSIDAFYLKVRKNMVIALLNVQDKPKHFYIDCGERWRFDVTIQEDNKKIDFYIVNTPRRQPGGNPLLTIEKAFNKLTFDNVCFLMYDLLTEMLFAKNFQHYNNIQTTRMIRRQKETTEFYVKSGGTIITEYPIILSQTQLLSPFYNLKSI